MLPEIVENVALTLETQIEDARFDDSVATCKALTLLAATSRMSRATVRTDRARLALLRRKKEVIASMYPKLFEVLSLEGLHFPIHMRLVMQGGTVRPDQPYYDYTFFERRVALSEGRVNGRNETTHFTQYFHPMSYSDVHGIYFSPASVLTTYIWATGTEGEVLSFMSLSGPAGAICNPEPYYEEIVAGVVGRWADIAKTL